MTTRTPLAAIVALLLTQLLFVAPAGAQSDGRISGIVRDANSNHALPFATISIVELQKGGLSDSKGEFLITGVPPGTYTLRCQMLGYEEASQPGVVVTPGEATEVEFSMTGVVVTQEKEIVVTGERDLVDVNKGSTIRSVDAKEIETLPVRTLSQVLEQQAGVETENNSIHVRGGRSDETVFIVDNVINRNLLTGESTAGKLNARSIAEVNVITGGFSAKYGQALSGIVDIKLKEGGDRLAGGFSIENGSNATRFFSGQLSGPDWLTGGLQALGVGIPGQASFLVDFSADFTDTYLPDIKRLPGSPSLVSGYDDSFFGSSFRWGSFFMPAQENLWRGLYKMTYRPGVNDKFELSFNKNMSFDQGFTRRPFQDFTGFDVGFPWQWSNRLDHYGTVTFDTNSQQLDWTHLTGKRSFFKVHASRFFTAYNQSVGGKNWTEYEQPQDQSLPPGEDEIYFFDTGDDFRWIDTYTEVYSLGASMVGNLGNHHEVEGGFRNDWQEVQYVTIGFPWDFDPDGLGSFHDLWKVTPMQGNAFLQDQMEFEGFTANVGLRVDYWFPGSQLEDAVADTSNPNISEGVREGFAEDTAEIFGRAFKAHVSPRVQVSHPITSKDNFFFNYGQFVQYPPYFYVYSKLTSVSSESFPILGNANLNPEISVQYEVGGNHTFTEGLAGNVTLFWKDIYDYPTATTFQRTQGTDLVPVLVYRNNDFARSRGFEVEIEKRRRKYWRYRGSYSFSVASGKASDPNEAKLVDEQGGNASETRLGEQFLFWNRPHRIKAAVEFRVDTGAPRPRLFGIGLPDGWGVSVTADGRSGRAYTPIQEEGEEAAKPYSSNGPFQVLFNLRFNKEFRFGPTQRINFTLTGQNIFDTEVARRIDPLTGEGYQMGQGSFSEEELGKLSSAEAREYRIRSLLENPSNYLAGARWRAGIEYDF